MGKALLHEPTDAPLSLEEWFALPENRPGELVDGRLVEEEVSGFVHEILVGFLIHVFRAWIRPRGGLVGGSDAKFAVGRGRGRKPDLTVYLPGSRKPPRQGLVTVPPDIAVEVVSPSPGDARRDRIEKMDDYAAFGIRFYWIVDPELRMVEIYELGDDGRYVRALGAAQGRIETVPGCDRLVLDVDELWREADSLDDEPGD